MNNNKDALDEAKKMGWVRDTEISIDPYGKVTVIKQGDIKITGEKK